MNSLRFRLAGGRGFSLIEVLIAVAVLGIGLLAVAALQIQGVRQNFDSYARSQAVMLANDYIERMYANRPGVLSSDYAEFNSTAVACGTAPASICATQSDVGAPAPCSSAALAEYDQYVVACGYPAADSPSGRVGGVRDLLQNGQMTVNCLDAAGAVATAPCPAGARYQVSMTWDEQIKGVDPDDPDSSANHTRVEAATLVMTVQP